MQGKDMELYHKLSDHRKAEGSQLIKLIDLVLSLLRGDGTKFADLGVQITESYLTIASSESVWATFEQDTIVPVCDDFKCLAEMLRKRYCTLYST